MKTIFITTAIVFMHLLLNAQEPTPTVVSPQVLSSTFNKVYIGGRVLATVTSLNYNKRPNGTVEATTVLGYGIGGFIGLNISKHFALQGEILYSSLAQKANYNGNQNTIKLRYINIPLLAVINSNVTKPVNLNVVFGPQIGIKTGSEITNDSSNNTDTLVTTVAVKPMDLGICYGAGLDFRISKSLSLGLGFRGLLGLVDISDDSKSKTTNNYYILDRSKLKTYSGYASLALEF